mgnify:CR=1 FL=1
MKKILKTYNDKGRKEAYEAYQKKFEKLGLTSELLAKWTIIQFKQNTRTDLIKNIQKDADTVLTKIKENGYNYEKDNKGRQIISSTEAYKIVISNKKCMVIDAAFDLEAKNWIYVSSRTRNLWLLNKWGNTIYLSVF